MTMPAFAALKSGLARTVTNLHGWRTRRKLVVIQSDDWFAIRTSSLEALNRLRALGVRVDACHYMKYDHFETADDLSALFEVLASVADAEGRHAVLTANCLSANPDFDRIEQTEFTEYHAEPSVTTASSIPGAEGNLDLWRQAIHAGVCLPQSHGREHLNIQRWLRALQSGTDNITREAFRYRMFGISSHVVPEKRPSFQAALDTTLESAPLSSEPILAEALSGFQDMFGFPSRSFIAPNYVWSNDVEAALHSNGVSYIQSSRVQRCPADDASHQVLRRHFTGKKNDLGQIYLVRNVDFEPSSNLSIDWTNYALEQIQLAFRLRTPAVISTHRVNYMGGLDVTNRERGLSAFHELLREIVKRWPSVEFISTPELGQLIQQGQNV